MKNENKRRKIRRDVFSYITSLFFLIIISIVYSMYSENMSFKNILTLSIIFLTINHYLIREKVVKIVEYFSDCFLLDVYVNISGISKIKKYISFFIHILKFIFIETVDVIIICYLLIYWIASDLQSIIFLLTLAFLCHLVGIFYHSYTYITWFLATFEELYIKKTF